MKLHAYFIKTRSNNKSVVLCVCSTVFKFVTAAHSSASLLKHYVVYFEQRLLFEAYYTNYSTKHVNTAHTHNFRWLLSLDKKIIKRT